MKNIFKILSLGALLGFMTSCEFFEAPDDTKDIVELTITYPAIALNGNEGVTVAVGGTFDDPGAAASLGVDDISSQVEVTSGVDFNTPGVYTISYSVSTTNELGSESTVSTTRFVNVVDPSLIDDVATTDLSGSYLGTGFANNPVVATVTSIGSGLYRIDRILSSGNNIPAVFAHQGGTALVMPNQPGPFGNVNTTGAGTSAFITGTGFNWTVFIGCCGNFGPIDFVKQ